MKKLIIVILLSVLTSCASSKARVDVSKVDKTFVPYVMNYIENHNSDITPELITGYEMSIKFDKSNYAPSYAGYCKMNLDINKREIYINPKRWEKVKEHRDVYITGIIQTCGAYKPDSYYGDIFYRAFSSWN